MTQDYPDFEISIRGHNLLSVRKGVLTVDGRDYARDLSDLSTVLATLSGVLSFAGKDQGYKKA